MPALDPSASAPLPSTAMPAGTPERDPPPGFVSFCVRFQDQCASTPNEATTVALTPQLWKELNAINGSVNYAIAPAGDELHFDRAEYWTIPTDGYGNCHDYMVTKRDQLAKAGIPLKALRMAIVVTPRNNRHAILTVSTDAGDYVLDNLREEILPWNQTGYTWIARQDEKNDWGWVALAGEPLRVADAHAPNASVMN